jgi:CheY-like chemotaxis protein
MEEDTMVRDAIGAILADAGCEVVHVNEGGEAIEHFVATRGGAPAFDAILLDQNVSTGVDGISANRRLKQIDPNVPTILMSGNRTSRHLTNFADHGFRASVAKPFTAQELLAALASVVQRRGAAC